MSTEKPIRILIADDHPVVRQGLAAMFIERLEGSYSGVMGLALFETAQLLAQFGIVPLKSPEQE